MLALACFSEVASFATATELKATVEARVSIVIELNNFFIVDFLFSFIVIVRDRVIIV
jgi:hypothetical protein